MVELMYDTATLADLLDVNCDVSTVYLRTPSRLDNADQQLQTRWKNARRELESAGTPSSAIAQIDEVLAGVTHHDGAALVVMHSDDGSVTLVESLDDDLTADLAIHDTLPRLAPLIETRQRSVAHVMVVTDRAGADIIAVTGGSDTDHVEVEGDELHIHRGHPGGWSQRRFQQRAENTWEANAREVAERVGEISRQVEARVVTVAGDVRATNFVMDHLDHETREIAVLLEEGDRDAIAEATVRAAADVVARDTTKLAARLRERDGRGEGSAHERDALAALEAGQVETVLVHDEPGEDRRAFFDRDGTPVEGRLADVAIRAAHFNGADVRIVPDSIVGGDCIAALLRW